AGGGVGRGARTAGWGGREASTRPGTGLGRRRPPPVGGPAGEGCEGPWVAQRAVDRRPGGPPDRAALPHPLPPRTRPQGPQAAARVDQPEAEAEGPGAGRQGGGEVGR